MWLIRGHVSVARSEKAAGKLNLGLREQSHKKFGKMRVWGLILDHNKELLQVFLIFLIGPLFL
jgi:hypothetical protein